MLEYPPIRVPDRLRDLPITSASTPAAMPWAETAPLVLVNFVSDQQVEEAPHPVLHVVGQRVAPGAGPVGLPQGAWQRAQSRLRRRSSPSVRGTPSLSVTWP